MHITSYIELTPAQEHTLNDFERVIVRSSDIEPIVVATFKTFQAQEVKIFLDKNGVITNLKLDN